MDALLGRADHAVVEGLAVDDRVDREDDIRAFVNDRGGVACADAEGGLAGAVRSLDHAGTAGRKDDVRLFHQGVRHVQRRYVDPFDDPCGCARLDRRFDGAFFRARMGRDDDAVAGLERDQAFEDRGRGRVGGWDDRRDHADGLGDAYGTCRFVFLDHAAGDGVLVGVVDIFGGVVVLDDLVLDDTHAGLFDGELRKTQTRLVGGKSGGLEDLIHLLLTVGRERFLRLSDAVDPLFKDFNAVDGDAFDVHDNSSFVCADHRDRAFDTSIAYVGYICNLHMIQI